MSKDKIIQFTTSKRLVLDVIGLSELFVQLWLAFMATKWGAGSDYETYFGANVYAVFILACCQAKAIPEQIIKRIGQVQLKKPDHAKFWDYWKRPDGACDCRLLQPIQGKRIESTASGMPSGHSTITGLIVATFLLNASEIPVEKRGGAFKLFMFILLTALFLVPLSRYDVKCHTLPQIIAGVALGFVLAFIFYIVDRSYLRKFDRFNDDRVKFYKWLLAK